MPCQQYDLIIIGGGPAGITAGIYAARQRLNTLLLTKQFGGQLALKAVDIENYPGFEKISGLKLIEKFKKHLQEQKSIEIEMAEVVKIHRGIQRGTGQGQGRDSPRPSAAAQPSIQSRELSNFIVSTAGKKEFKARAVLVASGADPRPLEVPGEKEFIGRGLSYCAVCDGPVFTNKTVAVIGGGNSGLEAAIFLQRIAKKVYVLERGSKPAADAANQELAKKSGKIEVITNAALKKVKGRQFVEEVLYEKIAGSCPPSSLKVDGVFVEIGFVPATGFVKDLVDFNERDEIKIDHQTCVTKTPGLFAAGDVSDVKVKQIVVAAGQGTQAALAVYNYLQARPLR
jgi:thioredoxin reductase